MFSLAATQREGCRAVLVHVGEQYTVAKAEIVAIIDLEKTLPTATEEFLKFLNAEGRLQGVARQTARACIVTDKGGYLSALATQTISRRVNKKV